MKKNFTIVIWALFILFIVAIFYPNKSSAIGLCSVVGNPTVRIDIAGQSFTSDGSITVAAGSMLPFTVYTYAEPSSINTITYPNQSFSYPGPCGYLGCPGRSYTTDPINSQGQIQVFIEQYCSGLNPPEATVTVTVNVSEPVCSINSFTADSSNIPYNTGTTLRFSFGGGSFSWAISLLSGSVNSTPISGVGSAGTASTNNLTATQTYRLSCNGGQAVRDLTVSVQAAPPPPPSAATLDAYWVETGTANLNKTVTPGQSYSFPFKFKKVGSGKLFFNNCTIYGEHGESPTNVYCYLTPGAEIYN